MQRQLLFTILIVMMFTGCGSDKIPSDLPIIQNSTIEKSFSAGKIETVVLVTDKTADIVNTFYRKNLSDAGWTAKIDRQDNGTTFQAWFSGDKGLMIDTLEEDGKTRVILNLSRGDIDG